jgi:hypothetical protein
VEEKFKMAASNFKNPPMFGPGISYETWKNELEIWRRMTDVDEKKQALAVTLSWKVRRERKPWKLTLKNCVTRMEYKHSSANQTRFFSGMLI